MLGNLVNSSVAMTIVSKIELRSSPMSIYNRDFHWERSQILGTVAEEIHRYSTPRNELLL